MRTGEILIHIWERLFKLIQGAATPGSLTPMADAVLAADGGYNSTETIELINERLGATAIGTHKRSLDYTFKFGDGPTKTHKRMILSEKDVALCIVPPKSVRDVRSESSGITVQRRVLRKDCRDVP